MTPPPFWHFSKNASDLVAGPFPLRQSPYMAYSAVLPRSLVVFFIEKGFLRNIFQPFLFSLISPAASFSAFKPDFLLVRQNLKDAGEDNRSAFLFQLRFALKWLSSVYPYRCHIHQAVTEKNIAWLSLNFVLYTSWVALYSFVCLSVRDRCHLSKYLLCPIYTGM